MLATAGRVLDRLTRTAMEPREHVKEGATSVCPETLMDSDDHPHDTVRPRTARARILSATNSRETKEINSVFQLMRKRETLTSVTSNVNVAKKFVPDSEGDMFQIFPSRVYSGSFSENGNWYFACTQDFTLHLYDTRDPNRFLKKADIACHAGRWTVTDTTLSPTEDYLAYSSITPLVYLARVNDDAQADANHAAAEGAEHFGGHDNRRRPLRVDGNQLCLNFADGQADDFGIWSIRFSSDGREIIAGTSDASIYLFDIETRKVLHRIQGHEDDVNAVCFADASTNIFYSGSDDTFVKVWDRRSLGNGARASGVFVGHVEGVTHVASKNDSRFCLSNSKDQTMKLWDLRALTTTEQFEEWNRVDPMSLGGRSYFDYRYMPYPQRMRSRICKYDHSIQTYRGHEVLKTLIRCGFGPVRGTGEEYVLSGSSDGRIHIYDLLTGAVHTRLSPPKLPADMDVFGRGEASICIRDVAWHPEIPVIIGTGWIGERSINRGCLMRYTHSGLFDDDADIGRLDESHSGQGSPAESESEEEDELSDDILADGD